jgi:hypothetical protein
VGELILSLYPFTGDVGEVYLEVDPEVEVLLDKGFKSNKRK